MLGLPRVLVLHPLLELDRSTLGCLTANCRVHAGRPQLGQFHSPRRAEAGHLLGQTRVAVLPPGLLEDLALRQRQDVDPFHAHPPARRRETQERVAVRPNVEDVMRVLVILLYNGLT